MSKPVRREERKQEGVIMLKAENITINTLTNPWGISEIPEIGWVLASDKNSVMQMSYQMQVAEDPCFRRIISDSGVVRSSDSTHVRPGGLQLAPTASYYVRVKVSDGREKSGWSETARFTTGLLSPENWHGRFITAENGDDAGNSKGTLVRAEFSVSSPVVSAVVYSSALGLYRMYLNGQKVGPDELTPGWTSYRKHLLYQAYDVTGMLRLGKNAVGALLGAGWYKGKMGFLGLRNNYGDRTAFLCQMEITYRDGTRQIVSTDGSWKGSDSPVLFSEIYDGETYDARLEQDGWCLPGFDCGGWRPVSEVPYDFSVLTAQPGCRVRECKSFPAQRVFRTPKGETVLDFGQNLTGWVHFRVRGKAGDRVVLNHFEVLDRDGNAYFANLRTAKQTVIYTLRGGAEETFHPHFTFQGFRYVRVKEYPGDVRSEDFRAVAVHSDLKPTGSFECSDTDLNRLQHNIIWGMKGNFVDIPTDCPQRDERLGWTGDAQIFCRTASFLADTDLFFRKWLKDLAADQTPEGGVPHVVPDILTGKCGGDWLLSQGSHSAAAWADAAVILPWTLYLTYGDVEVLRKQYDSMKAWIDFMHSHANGSVWNYKLQFGDWVALDAQEGSYFGATPNDLTCTAYYAYSTGLFAKICGILGRKDDYGKYSALYREIVDGFQKTFFTKDGSLTARTQTAHILALYFHLTPKRFVKKTVDTLLQLLREHDGHLVTGFVGTPYFCHALSQNGHTEEAYKLLLKEDFPSWLYQVKAGATTIWEHWDGIKPDGSMWSPDMNSFNHYAYGAVGEWLYRTVAGIEFDEKKPGCRHTLIAPHIGGGLTFVRASFRSGYGPVKVEWWTEDGADVWLHVAVPHNTTATIMLDLAKEVTEDAGQVFTRCSGGFHAMVGSGSYQFRFTR